MAKKKKNPIFSVERKGKRVFLVFTQPDGKKVSFESTFLGK
jgi:hypothetical protein